MHSFQANVRLGWLRTTTYIWLRGWREYTGRSIKGVSFYRNSGAGSVEILQDNLALSTKVIEHSPL